MVSSMMYSPSGVQKSHLSSCAVLYSSSPIGSQARVSSGFGGTVTSIKRGFGESYPAMASIAKKGKVKLGFIIKI
jgi:hypothetical protein